MKFIITFILTVLFSFPTIAQGPKSSIYSFELPPLSGNEPIRLSDYKGKKILIINIATESDSVNQFKSIIRVLKKDSLKHVVVIFCPSNSFNHESGSIQKLRKQYQGLDELNIRIAAPLIVKGEGIHPLFKWFTLASMNGTNNARVYDDFNKFIINEEGVFVAFMGKTESIDSDIMKKLLNH